MNRTQALPSGTVIYIGPTAYRLMTATLVESAQPVLPLTQPQPAAQTAAQGV